MVNNESKAPVRRIRLDDLPPADLAIAMDVLRRIRDGEPIDAPADAPDGWGLMLLCLTGRVVGVPGGKDRVTLRLAS